MFAVGVDESAFRSNVSILRRRDLLVAIGAIPTPWASAMMAMATNGRPE